MRYANGRLINWTFSPWCKPIKLNDNLCISGPSVVCARWSKRTFCRWEIPHDGTEVSEKLCAKVKVKVNCKLFMHTCTIIESCCLPFDLILTELFKLYTKSHIRLLSLGTLESTHLRHVKRMVVCSSFRFFGLFKQIHIKSFSKGFCSTIRNVTFPVVIQLDNGLISITRILCINGMVHDHSSIFRYHWMFNQRENNSVFFFFSFQNFFSKHFFLLLNINQASFVLLDWAIFHSWQWVKIKERKGKSFFLNIYIYVFGLNSRFLSYSMCGNFRLT